MTKQFGYTQFDLYEEHKKRLEDAVKETITLWNELLEANTYNPILFNKWKKHPGDIKDIWEGINGLYIDIAYTDQWGDSEMCDLLVKWVVSGDPTEMMMERIGEINRSHLESEKKTEEQRKEARRAVYENLRKEFE